MKYINKKKSTLICEKEIKNKNKQNKRIFKCFSGLILNVLVFLRESLRILVILWYWYLDLIQQGGFFAP